MSLKSISSTSKFVLAALMATAFALTFGTGHQSEVVAMATCGNTVCESGESCFSCPGDCGPCANCGDGTCDSNEDCGSCAADCGTCSACDSDGVCDSSEDCATCAADCGTCGSCDQDFNCDPGENVYNCPGDCGEATTPGCGDGVCDLSESCSNCGTDCGGCPGRTDFAQCPAVLPACTAEYEDCCHRDFASGSVMIPMDRCHQPLVDGNGRFSSPTANKDKCVVPAVPGSDDLGMIEAYGLVYRLLQYNFRVYWLVNPTKDPAAIANNEQPLTQNYTIATWILLLSNGSTPRLSHRIDNRLRRACAPVLRINQSTMTTIPGSYNQLELPVRGSAFMIDSADRARFDEFMQKTGEFAFLSGLTGASHYYDFSDVKLYEIQPNTEFQYLDFSAPGPAYPAFNGGNSAPVAMSSIPAGPVSPSTAAETQSIG